MANHSFQARLSIANISLRNFGAYRDCCVQGLLFYDAVAKTSQYNEVFLASNTK